MCIGIPHRVISCDAFCATVAIDSIALTTEPAEKVVSLLLMEDPSIMQSGDYLLVQAGDFAAQHLTPSQAQEIQTSLRLLAEGRYSEVLD